MNAIKKFVKLESSGGILLGLAAVLALLMENSPLNGIYESLLTTTVMIKIGGFEINKPLLLWINDGLMVIFFFLIGLEIKREILEGQLSSVQKISLPLIAAFGGILCPALIYAYFNMETPESLKGWAIPAATDIAFALGVITLLGNRIPSSIKIALVAIAILDDLAAIIIIAIFYTENLSLLSLSLGIIAIIILTILNKKDIKALSPYVVTGIFLWACVLKSGVHATLAGVVLAFFIPLKGKKSNKKNYHNIEHGLAPWVTYAILPIFAFANAGVPLTNLSVDYLIEPITIGIIAGLFIGKQFGVMFFTYLGVKLKLCKLPKHASWAQYYGMSLLTGIGFTMSLFIGTLAFDDIQNQNAVRLGVLVGSILSGVLGYMVLKASSEKIKS